MKNMFWSALAWLCTREAIRRRILESAFRTPYAPIMARNDDAQVYMGRWWLFNPYRKDAEGGQLPARWPWLPSVRVHHIALPDDDRHMHDHPWNARTIILQGWYDEEREVVGNDRYSRVLRSLFPGATGYFRRSAGDSLPLRVGEYHRIISVAPGGAYTLFFTFGESHGWGFNVDGKHVPWREYMGVSK